LGHRVRLNVSDDPKRAVYYLMLSRHRLWGCINIILARC
jgi:hypothetical protein